MKAQKVAAIILAAGGASRLGRPKQLLNWFGKPFINQVIDVTHQAQLNPVVVVTGAFHKEVEEAVVDEDVKIINNLEWMDGQSSSMQAGIKVISKEQIDAFIIFLCDQPQIPVELVSTMLHESKNPLIDIVVTSVDGKVVPPTLFKIKCINELMKLTGDQGGRGIIPLYKTKKIVWHDERILQDSDTEEDYQKLIHLYS